MNYNFFLKRMQWSWLKGVTWWTTLCTSIYLVSSGTVNAPPLKGPPFLLAFANKNGGAVTRFPR